MSDASSADAGPFEEQRRVYDLLSQKTRHLILQTILGHPESLPSLAELDHLIPKSTGAISDQLERLIDADVVAVYHHQQNADTRNLPSKFYGLTARGVGVLAEYNYLRGLPIARSVYRNTQKTTRVERHESAPRPELPDTVRNALTYGDADTLGALGEFVREENADHRSLSDQLTTLEWFVEAGIGPDHDGVKRSDLTDTIEGLTHQPRTVLHNLVEAGVLEKFTPPGPDTFAIDESSDEIVNGRVREAAESNRSALIDHLDSEIYAAPADTGEGIAVADGSGETVRHVLADAFDVKPDDVADTLRTGDPVERVNAAVNAIKKSESVEARDEYGQILFVNRAYRYRLTERAAELANL